MTYARNNPFATDRVLAFRYEPQGWTWDELIARLRAMNYRGAIVGPMGSGKTTLLEDLREKLAEAGVATTFLAVSNERRRLDRADWLQLAAARRAGAVGLVDRVEQLSWLHWRALLARSRGCRGLVITHHRCGRLPTLVETATSPALLERMVTMLDPSASREDLITLYARHQGNLREAIRELYDRRAALRAG